MALELFEVTKMGVGMQADSSLLAVYAYRFITETLFPHEQFQSKDVVPGGTLYCFTQVFLDKMDAEKSTPVEVLFGALSNERAFNQYKNVVQSNSRVFQVSETVSDAFKQLIRKPNQQSREVAIFCERLHLLREYCVTAKEHAVIDAKYIRAFEAVESCLRNNYEKVAQFEQILADWTKASPGFRTRAESSDPFIKALCAPIRNI